MTLNLGDALALTRTLTMFALTLQLIEILRLRKLLAPLAPWAWQRARYDFKDAQLLGAFFDFIFAQRTFTVILIAQFALVLAVFFDIHHSAIALTTIFLISLLISIRFRGTFNGGSDSMTLILLMALMLTAYFPGRTGIIKVALIYITIQSGLSYFIAGFVKIKTAGWRSGRTLSNYLTSSAYDVPEWVKKSMNSPNIAFIAAWVTMLFELSFVLMFSAPRIAPLWLACGMVFHLANFVTLGLNRFFWIWVATYPAIFWCATHL